MIACRMSQIGTSIVGTNDQGMCCMASEPGLANNCKGEPSADVMPKAIASTRSVAPNRFHAAIAGVLRTPPSFSSQRYAVDHTAFIYLVGPNGRYIGFLPPGTSTARLEQILRQHLSSGVRIIPHP
jgi:hypothetical protein